MSEVFGDERYLLSVKQVAEMLNCSTRHVYRLASAGKIPAPCHPGNLTRWPRPTIEKWIAEGCPAVRYFNKGGR